MDRETATMADYDADYTDFEFRELVRETEREIMNDALGVDAPEDGLVPDDVVADQSQLEGWDGRPLTNDELVTTTAYGHETPGFDRPLAWMDQTDAIRQNDLLREQLAQRDRELVAAHSTPEYQEQLRAHQEARRDQFLQVALDNDKMDAHLRWVDAAQGGLARQNLDRCDASLAYAHRQYGRDFEQTYREVSALKTNPNPMAQQIISSIFTAQDPGEALMSLAGSPLVRSLTEGRLGENPPPFMPGRRGAAAEPQSRRVEEDDLGFEFDHGGAGEEMEADVFRYAARR
jgi:hypothetical protein